MNGLSSSLPIQWRGRFHAIQPALRCYLWLNADLTPSDLSPEAFTVLATTLEDSHHIRRLLQCRECGQLYFYEFTEEIDWQGGNDPQHRTYIPVVSAVEAQRLDSLSPLALASVTPRIQVDWPVDAKSPQVRRIGR